MGRGRRDSAWRAALGETRERRTARIAAGRGASRSCRTLRPPHRPACRRAGDTRRRRSTSKSWLCPPDTSSATNGKLRPRRRQQRRQQVSFEVMDRHDRDAQRVRQRAGDAGADEQRAGEARALRCRRSRRDPRSARPASASTCSISGTSAPDVVARGELGHDAAVRLRAWRPASAARARAARASVSYTATPVSSQEVSMPRTRMAGNRRP